jgi:hypothetical protein
MTEAVEQTKDHPIWVLYDEIRTTCLNVKYYAYKLQELESRSRDLDVFVAVTAPGSTLSAFFAFKTDIGTVIWSCVAVASSIAATLKPILKYSTRVKSLQQTVAGYQALAFDLKEISNKVRSDQCYTRTHITALEQAMKKSRSLLTAPPDVESDGPLLDKLLEEVTAQFPVENFYIPKDKDGNKKPSAATDATSTAPSKTKSRAKSIKPPGQPSA